MGHVVSERLYICGDMGCVVSERLYPCGDIWGMLSLRDCISVETSSGNRETIVTLHNLLIVFEQWDKFHIFDFPPGVLSQMIEASLGCYIFVEDTAYGCLVTQ